MDSNSLPTRVVEPGNKIIKPFDSPIGRVGSLICFDVSATLDSYEFLLKPLYRCHLLP